MTVKKVKKEKVMEEVKDMTDEEIEKELKKLEDEMSSRKDLEKLPEEYEMGGVKYVREDIAYGEPVNHGGFPFNIIKSKKKRKWYNPIRWIAGSGSPKKEGNLLFLLDNEMGVKIFDNVQAGVFRIKEFEGTDYERESYIILKPHKLRTYITENGDIKRIWVADINNSVALPDEPIYSCKAVSEAIRTAVTDRRNFENAPRDSWWKRYTWLIPAFLILVYFLWYFGILDKILASFNGSSTADIVDTAKESVKNVAGGTIAGLIMVKTKIQNKFKRKKEEDDD